MRGMIRTGVARGMLLSAWVSALFAHNPVDAIVWALLAIGVQLDRSPTDNR